MIPQTSVFRDNKGSVFIQLNLERTEIIVDASEVASLLVKPSAGMVDRAGGVQFLDTFGNTQRVKLSPALVEKGPYGNGGNAVQMGNSIQTLLFPGGSAFGVLSCKKLILRILHLTCQLGKRGGKISNKRGVVSRASVYHILPHDHSQTVAVIIPSERFKLNMLSQHPEAQFSGKTNIVDHGFITGGCHQSV